MSRLDTVSMARAILDIYIKRTKKGCMERISWRARLAKNNINILQVDQARWYYEFQYHPRPGQIKWCKTYLDVPFAHNDVMEEDIEWADEQNAEAVMNEVLALRKELEG